MSERVYQIARGVRISADPDEMDRETLIRTIEDLADYASSLQIQLRAVRSVLKESLKK